MPRVYRPSASRVSTRASLRQTRSQTNGNVPRPQSTYPTRRRKKSKRARPSLKNRMTRADHRAADQGQAEYQQLVEELGGDASVHHSRGRRAKVNAKLKMAPPKTQVALARRGKESAPPRPVRQMSCPETSDSSEASGVTDEGPESPRMRAVEEGCGRNPTSGRSDPKGQGDSGAGGSVRVQTGSEEGKASAGSSAPRSSHRRAPPPPKDHRAKVQRCHQNFIQVGGRVDRKLRSTPDQRKGQDLVDPRL